MITDSLIQVARSPQLVLQTKGFGEGMERPAERADKYGAKYEAKYGVVNPVR
jgi:hypothetical protein